MEDEILLTDENSSEEEIIIADVSKSQQTQLPPHPDKKRKIKFSVKLKFSLLIAILISLITLFITIYLLNKEKKDLLIEMKYRAEIIARNLSRNVSEVFDDDTTRHQMLSETKMIKDVEDISVIDQQKNLVDNTKKEIWEKIIYSKFDETSEKMRADIPDEYFKAFKNSDKKFIENEINDEKFYIISPIKIENSMLGILKIVFTKKEIQAKIKAIQKNILIFTLIAILIGVIGAYSLTIIIIKPIKKLSEGAHIIGKGNLSHRININNQDELGQLADEFNNMTHQLYEAQKSMIEKERYEEQLEIARAIQVNLLPEKFPELNEISIAAFYKAAKGVGGDYYDVMHLKDKNKISSIIADVSGKGVPAALVMVMIRTIFHSTSKFVNTPDMAIAGINSGVTGRLSADKFATVFAFHYNYKTGVMEYSNGAHNPLLVYKAKTGEILELDTEGVPVGITEDAKFGLKTLQLENNDIMVMTTDGITEAMNINQEMFRASKLKEVIKKNASLSATEIKDSIIKDVDAFVGDAEQHDDMTLVVFKVNTINSNSEKENINEIKSKVINPMDPYSLLI